MENGQVRLRVVVQDRRRLLREGLAAILAAQPDIVVTAVVGQLSEIAGTAGDADVIVCADAGHPLPTSLARVIRLVDENPAVIIEKVRRGVADPPEPQLRLTHRESQIILSVSDGLSTGQIGALLGISAKTVENHKQRIFTKLKVQSQTHAVAVAHAAGLLDRADRSA